MNKPNKLTNPAVGIYGRRVGGEPENDADHFYTCTACGQAVDKRDFGAVFHHEDEGHEPITPDA